MKPLIYLTKTAALALLCLTSFIYSMDEQQIIPVIKGTIRINCLETACSYASEKYHNSINQALSYSQAPQHIESTTGNKKTFINSATCINIPVMAVEVEVKDQSNYIINWTNKELNTIEKFPRYIPITWLYTAQTGTQLSFFLHGYPVCLTCVNSQDLRRSFEKALQQQIKIFKRTPKYISHITAGKMNIFCCANSTTSHRVSPIPANFITEQLLKITEANQRITFTHGDKPFESVEKLVENISLLRLQEKNSILLLLQLKNMGFLRLEAHC